jgi:serine/threonine protein kinase
MVCLSILFLIYLVLYSCKDAVWKLADFGLTVEGSSKTNRPTQYARGTSGYRAPEFLKSDDGSMYNNKADVWSMGCILYELATGTCAFPNDWAVLTYLFSRKNMDIVLDPTFDSHSITTITKHVVDMLQIESLARPSASILLDEFTRECQPAPKKLHHTPPPPVQHPINPPVVSPPVAPQRVFPLIRLPPVRSDSMPPALDPPPEYTKDLIPNWAERWGSVFESTSTLVIGIDFGTTFTGVAYYNSRASDSKDLKKIVENINIVKTWPSLTGANTEKIPTVIAYEGGKPAAWGGTVRFNHKTQVQYFKLGLHERAGAHYSTVTRKSAMSGFLRNAHWKHPDLPQNKEAVDYAADYLTQVRKHIMDTFLPNQFGDVFLRSQQISYIITIPAIWSEKAKYLISQAVSRAGILEENLQLIIESEAAALYCATICIEADLYYDDRFMICDVGGMTAVRTLLYFLR